MDSYFTHNIRQDFMVRESTGCPICDFVMKYIYLLILSITCAVFLMELGIHWASGQEVGCSSRTSADDGDDSPYFQNAEKGINTPAPNSCPHASQKLVLDVPFSLALACLLFGMCALGVVVWDMATFRPRLYVLAEQRPARFIETLSASSNDLILHGAVSEMAKDPPRQYSELVQCEEELLEAVSNFCSPTKLRNRLTAALIWKMLGVLFALNLIGYSLSHMSGGRFVGGPVDAGIAEHLYFTFVTFLAIGFGDWLPYGWVGYLFVGLAGILLLINTYFFITFILAGHSEFVTNMRRSVHVFVASKARW